MMNESVCPEVLIPVMACLEGTTYDRARDVFISVCEFMEKHGGRYARKHLCYRRALQDYESSPRWPPSFNLRSTFPDEPNPWSAGYDAFTIKALMGHRDMKTTERYIRAHRLTRQVALVEKMSTNWPQMKYGRQRLFHLRPTQFSPHSRLTESALQERAIRSARLDADTVSLLPLLSSSSARVTAFA